MLVPREPENMYPGEIEGGSPYVLTKCHPRAGTQMYPAYLGILRAVLRLNARGRINCMTQKSRRLLAIRADDFTNSRLEVALKLTES